jgi:hypothetical protein
MTLTEFLLARVVEDEDRIIHEFDCDRFNVYDYGSRYGECDCNATSRLLAECEAKRRIVATMQEAVDVANDPDTIELSAYTQGALLKLLALPYADHADYREEWRP